MATANESIDGTIADLAEQIDCSLLSYEHDNQSPSTPGPLRYLFPVGPYAIGLWKPGDEVHLVCLTDNSSNTFWEYIAEKLRREDLPRYDCIVSETHDQHVLWLHYCRIPRHFDLATFQAYGFPKYPESTYIPQTVRQNLSRLHDSWYLHATLGSDIPAFRKDYQTLRSWAEAAGIFSKSFGTLDAESLAWLLSDANTIPVQSSPFSKNIQQFVDRYSNPDNPQKVLTPSGRQAYAPPPHNAVDCCNTIASEVQLLTRQPALLDLRAERYYQNFCDRYSEVILITAECWSPKRRESFHSDLVNEIAHLPERSRKAGSDLKAFRIWPHAFRPSNDEWVYVIGVQLPLSRKSDTSQPMGTRTSRKASSKPYLTLDATIGTSTIRICSVVEAKNLPERHSMVCPLPPNNTTDTPTFPSTSKVPSPSNKFPPASQVLSRLRWDPVHTSHDYEVGYLDRFEGLMWLPLEHWGKETEDEEFIPEHRIRIFRRVETKSKHVVVWDRERRICLLE
jgi:uncharacterized protein (UPF0248 family)